MTRIETAIGPIDLRPPVALVIQASGPPLQVQITAGGPPFGAATSTGMGETASAPVVVLSIARGASGSSSLATASSAMLPLTSGSTVTATLTQPARWLASGVIRVAGDGGSPALPGAPLTLATGSAIAVRVDGLGAAGDEAGRAPVSSAPATALRAGQALLGVVVAVTPEGQPVLRTPAGTLILVGLAPPLGRSVAITIVGEPMPPTPPPAPALPALTPEVVVTSSRWPALDEALRLLNAMDPATGRHLVEAVLLRPDSRLAAAILLFLSALRQGGPRPWLGEAAARALEQSHPEVWSQLGEDFRRLARTAAEPIAGDWRLAQVPLFHETGHQAVRLLIRDSSDDRSDTRGSAGARVRFVLDFSLSRLGRVQLDGLVTADAARFDLIVRSEVCLPAPLQDDIRGIFCNASALRGLAGGVDFRNTPDGFVEPLLNSEVGRNAEWIV